MPSPTWRVLSAELVTRGRVDLQRDLRQAVRREGEPAVAAVRAAIMAVDVTSSKGGTARPDRSTGLRARVAAATKVQATTTGVKITVNGRQVDLVYGKSLAWYLAATRRPWRHPVFGRRANPADWQVQQGQPVFFPTLDAHRPAFRAAILRAMEDTARRF